MKFKFELDPKNYNKSFELDFCPGVNKIVPIRGSSYIQHPLKIQIV